MVVYARSAYPDALDGSAFVELRPPLGLPFHLASRAGATGAPVGTVQAIARGLADRTTS